MNDLLLRSVQNVLDQGYEIENPRTGCRIKFHSTSFFQKRYMVFNRGVWFGPKGLELSMRIFNNQNL
jgi:hypothetical protein